ALARRLPVPRDASRRTELRSLPGEQLRGGEPASRPVLIPGPHAGAPGGGAAGAQPGVSLYAGPAHLTMASRSDSSRTSSASSLIAALESYRPPAHHWDEVLDPNRSLRPQWARFANQVDGLAAVDLARKHVQVAREIHDNGVTYNVYASADGH